MRVDQMLLAGCGVNLTEAELHHRFVGMTFQAMIAEVEAEYGRNLPADLEARKDDLMLEVYRRELQPVKNVPLALPQLTLPMSIGTNGPRARASAALKIVGIDGYFGDRLTTFEDVQSGKPAPDIYRLAAERAGFAAEECLVIEDSVAGVTAAVAAGCPALGFTGAHQYRAEHAVKLAGLGAFHVFNDMAELPGIVEALT